MPTITPLFATAPPPSHGYRYFTTDLLTGRLLCEQLPFSSPTFSDSLGDTGQFTGDLAVRDASIQALDPWNATLPRRSALWVARDSTLVWGGIITLRPPYQASEGLLHVTAATPRDYFGRRLLRPVGGPGSTKTLSYTQTDQLDIARALIADMAAVQVDGLTPGDLGFEIDQRTSGILRDRKKVTDTDGTVTDSAYEGYSFGTYLDDLDNLAGLIDGFEWRIDPYFDAGQRPRWRIVFGYPRLGTGLDISQLLCEYPGNIVDYGWGEDGENSDNYMVAIGAGEEQAMVWNEAYSTDELNAGYPLYEGTTSYTDVSDPATLLGHAQADLAQVTGDIVTPSLVLAGGSDPQFGTYQLGDYALIKIDDPARFGSSGMHAWLRITGWSVQPGPPERVTLTVEAAR